MSKHTEAARAALAHGNVREAVEALTAHLEQTPEPTAAAPAPKKAAEKKKGGR